MPRAIVLVALLSTGCPPSAEETGEAETTWFATCGDPACSGYAGPFDGVPLCDTEVIGEPCADEAPTCDPEDSCNALRVCATEDPTAGEGGCPISRKRHKRDIQYLTPEEQARLGAAALSMPLATWSYRWEPPGAPAHLGFLIDDNVGSPAVAADGEHVDLYGYASVVLAAAQEQARTVAAQAGKLAEQAARLEAQERRITALEEVLEGRFSADGTPQLRTSSATAPSSSYR